MHEQPGFEVKYNPLQRIGKTRTALGYVFFICAIVFHPVLWYFVQLATELAHLSITIQYSLIYLTDYLVFIPLNIVFLLLSMLAVFPGSRERYGKARVILGWLMIGANGGSWGFFVIAWWMWFLTLPMLCASIVLGVVLVIKK